MIHTDRLDHIAAHGTGRLPRKVRLADDTVLSIHAGYGAYSTPRPRDRMVHEGGMGTAPANYPGPYTAVEVFVFKPTTVPDEWAQYSDGAPDSDDSQGTLYSPVPVDLVRALIHAHGGEHVAQDEWDDVVKAMGEGYLRDAR
jgi:hypothetical protein